MTLEVDQIIDGKYRITRMLGEGGMGAVYEASNIRIVRRVAIKVLHAHVSGDSEAVRRFEREAQAAGRIGSEHICEVFDLGSLADGARYIVMEFMEGETLGQRIQSTGRLKAAQVMPVMTQLLDGLGAAHEAGIIHRDIKPDNVFLLKSRGGVADFVKILDFGVSKFSPLGEDMGQTRVGTVVGTPYYMSPEQARGATPVDARSDIYAVGVLLYQAATGVLPHDAGTFNELLFKIVMEEPPPPQQFAPDLELEFCAIIQKAMMRDPARRYQTCAEFRDALLGWRAAKESFRPPSGRRNSERPQRLEGGGGTVALPGPGTPPLGLPPPSTRVPEQAPSTAASWGGNTSPTAEDAPVIPVQSSRAGPIAVVVGLLAAGGLAAGYFALRSGPTSVAPATTAIVKHEPTSSPPPPATAATAPTPTPEPSPAPEPSAPPTATTASAPPDVPTTSATVSSPVPTSSHTAKASGTPPGGKKRGPGVPNDFGY